MQRIVKYRLELWILYHPKDHSNMGGECWIQYYVACPCLVNILSVLPNCLGLLDEPEILELQHVNRSFEV